MNGSAPYYLHGSRCCHAADLLGLSNKGSMGDIEI